MAANIQTSHQVQHSAPEHTIVPLSLTPGFSRVIDTPKESETVSTVWRRGVAHGKPLKRFFPHARKTTWLKPGANEK
jgi:hypothetical protein